MLQHITYEMFGAVGDGTANDMPAIARAHEEANRLNLPVRAREGAVYYIAPEDCTAVVKTSADWTGAKFIIDDVNCENIRSSVFLVPPAEEELPLEIRSLVRGQNELANPHGVDLFVVVKNERHMDYIRRGLNQDNGHARTDCFILRADGTLPSPVSFDFDEVTSVHAWPISTQQLTLTGGEFTTIANQAESRYNYHGRNISVQRSNTVLSRITHLVTGEKDHGAPYRGFVSITNCARVTVQDCLFTAHYIYWTIGSANLTVPMGSYDIDCGSSAEVSFLRCRQLTDIHDPQYWGLMGTNFCRDLLLEDCEFSRFDAHMGVTNCTVRRCLLGWQGLNAIGHGLLLLEDTTMHSSGFIRLRDDYGCTWRGDVIISNCAWRQDSGTLRWPADSVLPKDQAPKKPKPRALFSGSNDGTHDFGYVCYMPQNVTVDGLTLLTEEEGEQPLYVFNNYADNADIPDEARRYMPVPPARVTVRGVQAKNGVALCENPAIMPDTEFSVF